MQSQRSPQRAEKAALNCGSRQLIMLNMNGVRRYAHLLRKTRKPNDKSVGESRIRMSHLNVNPGKSLQCLVLQCCFELVKMCEVGV